MDSMFIFKKEVLDLKPVIGITCKKQHKMKNYVDAIREFGGEPILYASLGQPNAKPEFIPEYIEKIDGLLLPGGGAIDPGRYSQERKKKFKTISRSRDALEIRFCQKALETDIPIFGICRGVQVMCVATGGHPYQDIRLVFPEKARKHKRIKGKDSRHEISIVPCSRLSEIANESSSIVRSAHQMAIHRIGDGFVETAHADGIIEAMEIPSRRFVIGVQYHPERMLQDSELRGHAEKLFTAFINAASL